MKANDEVGGTQIVLGELTAAVNDASIEPFEDERDTYLLASLALAEILKKAPLRQNGITQVSPEDLPKNRTFH